MTTGSRLSSPPPTRPRSTTTSPTCRRRSSSTRSPAPPIPAPDQSFLAFNGCTNFNAKITLAIPSTSCSSDAVGVGSGLAGLIVSAALNARDKGALAPHPTCRLVTDGPDPGGEPDPARSPPNEVRQVMATATVDGASVVDDVDFAGDRRAGRPRAELRQPAGATAGLHRPQRRARGHGDPQPGRADGAPAVVLLPRPRRARPVLRIRQGEHQPVGEDAEQRPGRTRRRRRSRRRSRSRRRPGTSRSIPTSPRSRSAATSTPAATPTPAGSSSPPATTPTTTRRPTATSSPCPRPASATGAPAIRRRSAARWRPSRSRR